MEINKFAFMYANFKKNCDLKESKIFLGLRQVFLSRIIFLFHQSLLIVAAIVSTAWLLLYFLASEAWFWI